MESSYTALKASTVDDESLSRKKRSPRVPIIVLAFSLLGVLLFGAFRTASQDGHVVSLETSAPVAEKRPAFQVIHGVTITDDYTWLRDLETDPKVLEYIDAENKYADAALLGSASLRASLEIELQKWDSGSSNVAIAETRQRSARSCQALPADSFEYGSYLYYSGSLASQKWPVWFRRSLSTNGNGCMADEDKIVVNFNHFVNQSEPYFAQGVFEPNLQNEDLVAFSFDINGAEKFSLVVIDVRTRRNSPGIPSTYYSARWGAGTDASCIYYNVVDPVWGTPRKVYQYCLTENSMETLQGAESLVYVEEDVTLTTEVSATTDGRYTYIQVAGQATSEVLLLRTAEGSHASVHPVFRRVQETQYHIDHYNGSFFVLTNADQALNYRILRVNVETAITSIPNAITGMEPVICHRVDETIEKLEILEDHLVAWVRKDGLRRFRTLDLTSLRSGCADAPLGYDISESAIPYSLFPGITFDMDSRLYRRFASKNFVYSNSSFASPSRSWLYDLEAGTSSLLSEQRVAGLGHYTERRVWATSSMESTIKVPISLIHASNRTGPQALLLSAYGAYGTYTDPTFATRILPLLDRGITYAMCHPRGDGNMGASWYLDGKYASKKHTFEDVETCLKGLIDQGYTAPGRVAVCGRSAGGLITGDVVNRLGWQPGLDSAAHPDAMVKAVVAQVPFIDPIGDMTDETIPWTPYEYYEWGNPLTNNTIFEAMREYSPYGNISPNRTFPQLFVSAGLQDGRVGFFEPAKWVAKLRTAFKKEDQHNLVLRVRNSGHFGGGDYAETAEWLAFVINAVA